MKKTAQINQKGFAHILILLAAVGLIAFLLISNSASFKNGLFGSLFPKPASLAANIPGVTIVDTSNNVLTQTTTPTVRVQLAPPWPLADAGGKGAVAGISTATFQVNANTDGVNEDGTNFTPSGSIAWLGNGASAASSWTGFRFTGVSIPKGATITSAKLQVKSSQNQWIGIGYALAADAVGNSAAFSSSTKPSQRTLTGAKINHNSNAKWDANSTYTLDEMKAVIQEVVGRSDWSSGNALSLILKGSGSTYGRKFISNGNSIKLVVTYDSGGVPTTSTAPTAKPSTVVTSPSPIAPSPSVKPQTVAMAILAEDSGFTQNVVHIIPLTTDPTYTNYTFLNATLGTKTLYAKFTSSTGTEQTFNSSIQLVSPAVASPSPTPVGNSGVMIDGHPVSAAYDIWVPNPKYDTCPSYPAGVTTDQQKTDYIKSIHNAYKVLGPDGKWYPTWHPPVDPATGCKFGHEHGRDPKLSLIWDQVRNYFAYDANHNGSIDSTELASAGLPFAYANEQMDSYNGGMMMRHEDHMGHKVDYANGEADSDEHFFGNDTNLGLVVPIVTNSNPKWTNSGARCYHFAKVHQGVNSPDATMNNLHEVFYFADCKGPTPAYDMKVSTAIMMKFGAAGEFTDGCDPDGPTSRTQPVITSKNATNQNYPGTRSDGSRIIVQRYCIEKHFLVPPGGPEWSMNPYEAWLSTVKVTTPAGKDLVSGINLTFDVEDSSRYYWPGHADANTGQLNVGRWMDLCYENFNGRVSRGGLCGYPNVVNTKDVIKWDDPRSSFRGTNRGMYFQPPILDNAGGPTSWYTDPFGGNAQTAPFPGSIRQDMSAKKANHNDLGQTDPRVDNRTFDDGHGTVHAPN